MAVTASKSANTQVTDRPKRKAPKTAFKKGVSGNVSGRPKKTQEEHDLIALCKAKTIDALDVILGIMNLGENERNKLAAANIIMERGHGKAVQHIEAKVTTHEASLDDLA